jgi:uncharacterized membrane protein YqhA
MITQQEYYEKQLANAQTQIRLAKKRVDLALVATILVLVSIGLQILLWFIKIK